MVLDVLYGIEISIEVNHLFYTLFKGIKASSDLFKSCKDGFWRQFNSSDADLVKI